MLAKRFSTLTITIILLVLGVIVSAEGQVDQNPPIQRQFETEIKNLANNPSVQRAMDAIVSLEEETRKNLIMLTEIPAPPFKEEERAKKMVTDA